MHTLTKDHLILTLPSKFLKDEQNGKEEGKQSFLALTCGQK